MSTVTTVPSVVEPEPDRWFVLPDVSWEGYLAINNAVVNPRGLRMIYCDGRLTLVTTSRKHDWYAERLAELVKVLAEQLGILWEDGGGATYRREEMNSGVEGDKTFYFGEHAELMKGPQDIDLAVQPPPDLAIEVEVSHPADHAMVVWGRLGVPEVWRFDPIADQFGFWLRQNDGTYVRSESGRAFPMLTADDILGQMQLADQLGAGRWNARLAVWVRDVIVPRQGEGG
ncbi:MAG: Uma2 family endonuclease [Isosphaerales bacterium]